MKKQENSLTDLTNLRLEAEKLYRNNKVETPSPIPLADVNRLIHELEVHQIELEMQNEQLKFAMEQAETASRKYSELYDLAPSGYVTLSKDGRIIELNLSGAQMLGKKQSLLISSLFTSYISDDSKPVFDLFLNKIFKHHCKVTCELILVCNDTSSIDVFVTGNIAGNDEHCVISMVDVSERKNIEKALLISEDQSRSVILQTAMDGFWLLDMQGRLLEVNDTYCRMSGYSKQELSAMDLSELEVTENADAINAHIKKVISIGEDRFETRHRRKDGSIFDVEISVQYQAINGGRFVAFMHDITDRKKTEESLKESEQRYRSLFEASNDAIFLVDLASGRYMDCNPLAETLTGYTREEIRHMKTGTLIPPPQKGEIESNIEAIVAGKVLRKETEIVTKSGKLIPVEFNSSLLTINNKNLILSMLHDISERRAAEEALKRSEESVRAKLQSILSPEGSIADLELNDIIDAASIQKLMDNFYELVQIPMAIIDVKGKILVGVGWQDICTRFHRMHPESSKNCIESDIHLTKGIPEGEFRLYKCKNNMWDMATPLNIGGEHKGNLFMGQFFLDDEPIKYPLFNKQANKFGFSEQDYMAAFDKVPRISTKKLGYAKAFFLNLSYAISQLSYSNIKLARAISQQKIIEDILRVKDDLLIKAEEIAHLGSWSLDLTTNHLTWSDEMYNIFGVPPLDFEATYEGFLKIVYPEDRDIVNSAYTNSIKEGKDSYEIEHRIFRKHTGELRYVVEKCEHFRDISGNIIRSFGMSHDITDKKLAELELRENERLLRESQAVANIGSYSVDLINKTWKASPEINKIFGIDETYPHELEAWEKVIHPDHREQMTTYLWQIAGEKKRFNREYKIIRVDDGKESWVHGLGEFIFDSQMNPVRLIGTVQDINERKLAQEELLVSETKFRKYIDFAPHGIFVADETGKYIEVNSAACQITGYNRDELLAMNLTDLLTEESMQSAGYHFNRVLTEGFATGEFAFLRKDRVIRYWSVDAVKLSEQRFLAFVIDITDRKKADAKLKHLNEELEARVKERTAELSSINASLQLAEEKYRTVADYTYDWEYWLAPDGTIKYMSPSVERITGYTIDEFKADPLRRYHIVFKDDRKLWEKHVKHSAKLPDNEKNNDFEFRIVTKNGEIRWIGHTCRKIYNDGKYLGIRVSNRDITEKVKAENELLNITVKIEEVERNRISRELHDGLGPLLSTIKLYFQWLAETNDAQKIKIITEKGNESIDRAIRTTREVSHGLSSQVLNTYGYVGAVLDFTQSINATQKLYIDFNPNSNERFSSLLEITLFRITTELVNNTLKFASATRVEIDFDYFRDKNLINFTYSDNGIGFDLANFEKAGKGIGLMNIKQRIKLVQGKMNIESGMGKGLKVQIELPVINTVD